MFQPERLNFMKDILDHDNLKNGKFKSKHQSSKTTIPLQLTKKVGCMNGIFLYLKKALKIANVYQRYIWYC